MTEMVYIPDLVYDALLYDTTTHSTLLIYLQMQRCAAREVPSMSRIDLGALVGMSGRSAYRSLRLLKALGVIRDGASNQCMYLLLDSSTNPIVSKVLAAVKHGTVKLDVVNGQIYNAETGTRWQFEDAKSAEFEENFVRFGLQTGEKNTAMGGSAAMGGSREGSNSTDMGGSADMGGSRNTAMGGSAAMGGSRETDGVGGVSLCDATSYAIEDSEPQSAPSPFGSEKPAYIYSKYKNTVVKGPSISKRINKRKYIKESFDKNENPEPLKPKADGLYDLSAKTGKHAVPLTNDGLPKAAFDASRDPLAAEVVAIQEYANEVLGKRLSVYHMNGKQNERYGVIRRALTLYGFSAAQLRQAIDHLVGHDYWADRNTDLVSMFRKDSNIQKLIDYRKPKASSGKWTPPGIEFNARASHDDVIAYTFDEDGNRVDFDGNPVDEDGKPIAV